MSEVPPVLLSAVLCERVIFDRITGMPSLINILQVLNSPKYPMQHGGLVFFCELTNGHGKTKIRINMVDVQEDEKVAFKQEGMVEFKDVQQVVTLAMNLQGIVFARCGEYRFQVYAEDQLLGERRVVCREITPKS